MPTRSTTLETYENGVKVDERTVTYEVSQEQVNEETIRAQAAAALDGNRTYIAAPVTSTTAARLSALEAQVKTLTRQNQRLIRLAIGLLDGVE